MYETVFGQEKPRDLVQLRREIGQIYRTQDMGPQLQLLHVGEDIARGRGASNIYGVFEAQFVDADGEERCGVAKIKYSTNLFHVVHAASKLDLGMRYYGHAPIDYDSTQQQTKHAMLLSFVPGVWMHDPLFSLYFTHQSLQTLEKTFKLFADIGIRPVDFGYLLDTDGKLRLVDYDYLIWRPEWTQETRREYTHVVNREAELLTEKLDSSWHENIEAFRERLCQYIENKK